MQKLFWQDPYLKECTAKVMSVNGNKVQIDKTVLYAFSGGQASDAGTIGGVNVAEAMNGDPITYTLESEPRFKEGEEVPVILDWEKRYRIMKLHTAAHVVYEIFKEKVGNKKIIGSNITEQKARIDFLMDDSISEYLPAIETSLKEIVEQDLEVKTYDDQEEAGKRWWEIPGKYKMPCGGTHVARTSEIGEIKLKRENIGAGKERIEITLGG